MKRFARYAALLSVFAALVGSGHAAPLRSTFFGELHWRMIGPFRGGRTVAVTGVSGEPNLFYIAAVNGGVWKSTDAGRVWKPIFDGQSTGSIGAIAVAPSDHRTLYVGSGEGLQRPDLSTGDGIYKSTDGGSSWQHLGLRDGQQIAKIVVDPHDAQRLFVAVLGHPYGPNTQRGVYRSTDGGASFTRVLYQNENTGAIDVALDPADPQHLYAAMWAARHSPWTNGGTYGKAVAGTGLFTSLDGGATWRERTHGLPTRAQQIGRIGLTISPTDPQRMYALVDSPSRGGLYRSDDAGEHWERRNSEERIWGRGEDFAGVTVDPRARDVVYVANTSTYRSSDGGRTFTAIKGAPGGDDYHTVWLDPQQPSTILLGSDQGATISVNGGLTWSSWYNQPTAQFYHVATDNRFPYWVYGGQQESGSAAVASRGNDGAITFRDFHPVGAEEYGYIAPDPLHPNLIYGGKGTRFDWTTMQTQDVAPVVLRSPKFRYNRTAPLMFSPADPQALYLGANVVFKTRNGGHSWSIVSPDLTRANPGVPPNFRYFTDIDPRRGYHRGVVYSLGLSPRDARVIWAGTDDGLVWRTADGGAHWHDITPPALGPWNKIAQIDPSHTDVRTAYIAVNKFRLDDLHPYIYRTRDSGKTWTSITGGLPTDAPVNTVREDPVRPHLLFCGTERSVYVSFNDGDAWQSLQNDLPSTSVRDLVIHASDLIAGTHGRSFWILDDITPLRESPAGTAPAALRLLPPRPAYHVDRDINPDTPLPPEEPAGENPPDGAVLNYVVPPGSGGRLTIDIFDVRGRPVRHFVSDARPEPIPTDLDIPTYWIRPQRAPDARPGLHRFVWDLHAQTPRARETGYPIAAIFGDTPREPRGPMVVPGSYRVRLNEGAAVSTAWLRIESDPRSRVSAPALQAQYELATALATALTRSFDALGAAGGVRRQLANLPRTPAAPGLRAALGETQRALGPLLDEQSPAGLAAIHGNVATVYARITAGDGAPTREQATAAAEALATLGAALAHWHHVRDGLLPRLNAELVDHHLTAIRIGIPVFEQRSEPVDAP